jgi:hypothetical protein
VLRAPNSKASAADVEAAAAQAAADLESARQEVAAAEAGYKASLLEDDKQKSTQAEARVTLARIALDRADALLGAMHAKRDEVMAAENEADRRRRYKACQDRLAAVQKRLPSEYERLAVALLSLVAEAAEAVGQAEAVNRDLPLAAEPLDIPELLTSYRPAVPEEVLQQRNVTRWVFENGNLVPDERLVRPLRENEGSIESRDRAIPVYRRDFLEIEFHPAVAADHADPFWKRLGLPALDETAPPFWTPCGADAAEIAELARTSLAASRTTRKRARPVQTRLVAL